MIKNDAIDFSMWIPHAHVLTLFISSPYSCSKHKQANNPTPPNWSIVQATVVVNVKTSILRHTSF